MNANTYGFQTGMKVYVQRRRWDNKPVAPEDLDECTITKIGRKWIELDGHHGRYDPEKMRVDGKGYGERETVWTSRQEYAESTRTNKLWSAFRRQINNFPPEGLADDEIVAFAARCGIDLSGI